MKKLLILMVFLILPSCLAAPLFSTMCADTIEINSNCTMLTPSLTNCTSFDYVVVNMTGELVEQNNLTQQYGDIYYINISLAQGYYIIRLCDGTTREVKVQTEDQGKMIIGIIVLLPMLLAFLLMWAASSIGEDHNALRIFLFMLSMFPFLVSLNFGLVAVVKYYNFPELQELIGSTAYWFELIVGVLITYFLIYIIYIFAHLWMQKKEEAKIKY